MLDNMSLSRGESFDVDVYNSGQFNAYMSFVSKARPAFNRLSIRNQVQITLVRDQKRATHCYFKSIDEKNSMTKIASQDPRRKLTIAKGLSMKPYIESVKL